MLATTPLKISSQLRRDCAAARWYVHRSRARHLEKFDEVKVMAVKGGVKAVKLLYGVGVVAETPWAAFAARRAVEGSVSWRSAEVWCGTQSQTMPLEATADALGIDRRLDMLAQCSAGTLLNKSHPRNQLKPLIASDF